ncbi:helix-turn-helix domain-containing protein [Aestuariivita sp.]|uniref:helix-turn-helix domain-containing protein n=1 Tax=Aestuariivita sp. TaxID=1872407 RepID=UPI0021733D1A|nr:helix-turn-helix domain-containing protein [Aestuariivita sp.]MCE8009664.1 helix-turn-helix domain-containing protein [Aestuariivita sp.]
MGKHDSQLSLEEGRKLWRWRDAGIAIREIAARLSRNPSTLHREIRRNTLIVPDDPRHPCHSTVSNGCIASCAAHRQQGRLATANHCD